MKKLDGWQIPLGMLALFLIGGTIHAILGWLETYPIIAGSLIAGTVAITVGLITFSGVRLTLKHATQRMHFELENSRKESDEERRYAADKAKTERIATMRREVYLQAAEDLMTAQHFLGSMPTLDPVQWGKLEGLQAFQSSVSKIAVVGEPGTVKKARALSVAFASMALKNMQVLAPMNMENGRVSLYEKRHDELQRDLARINAEIIHHNETLKPSEENNARFEALLKSSRAQRESAQAAVHAAAEARKNANEIVRKFAETLTQEFPALMAEIEGLLNAVRLELGLITDPAEFAAQSAQLLKQMQGVADKVVEQNTALMNQTAAK